ncbi:hypothetical protein LOTGIDRAFT_239216 [Lottia gigantea]|uniref:Complement Clr-like EGF domain-containing protein n=1 Tax=Lottia gigantea TaxID=225164 RepID=V3ZZU9_LOTGI|nr:hypothetical protein LOTGIDRAFT_239216 [Lottia gigantea]ESO97078.1 hypothetical protein LOTGIDRAFT_239216 [Lottia gigantea]
MNALVTVFFSVVGVVVIQGQGVSVCDTVTCINGFCTVNALNQAVCQCEPGYKPSGTPRICVDIDECVEYDTLCNQQTGCCNFLGTYSCLPCSAFRQRQQQQPIPYSLLRLLADKRK